VGKVVWRYLDGLSIGEIAAKVGVSKTSVYNLIELKNTLAFKLALYHKIAVDLAKKGSNIQPYADIIRELLEMYGIDKSAAWRTVVAIPSACYKIGIEPYNLMAFLQKFEQFVINSKAKNQKEVFENVRSSLDTYFSFVRRKIG
jgi:AcrR family transcriptional regulator